jgi:hypothetical protein
MVLERVFALSLRDAQTLRVFSVDSGAFKGVGTKNSQLKKMVRSPSDEVLLTELAIDAKDITIYDITSVIYVGEKPESKPHGEFKCYMDNTTKEFFIEISDKTKLEAFTKSALLNILDVAENAEAETVHMCLRKTLDRSALATFMKTFLFIGFQQLTPEEQKNISMTQTHTLLKYQVTGYDYE